MNLMIDIIKIENIYTYYINNKIVVCLLHLKYMKTY